LVAETQQTYGKDFSKIDFIFVKIAPVQSSSSTDLSYIHKSVYEFYIAQSVIEETLAAKLETIDLALTKLN
jgi:hypothetical protein